MVDDSYSVRSTPGHLVSGKRGCDTIGHNNVPGRVAMMLRGMLHYGAIVGANYPAITHINTHIRPLYH